jgi:hypothetical protein
MQTPQPPNKKTNLKQTRPLQQKQLLFFYQKESRLLGVDQFMVGSSIEILGLRKKLWFFDLQ